MRLGEMLQAKGMLSPERLQAALSEQARYRGRLGTHLVKLGFVDVDTVAMALSVQRGYPAVLRAHVAALDPRLITLFPARIVNANKVIPIGYTTHKPPRVVVACVNPTTAPLEELAFAAGTRVEPWIAPEALMQACLEKYFGAAPSGERYVSVNVEPLATSDSVPVESATHEAPKLEPPPPPPEPAVKARPKPPVRMLSPPPPPPSLARPADPPPPPPAPVFEDPPAAAPDPPPREAATQALLEEALEEEAQDDAVDEVVGQSVLPQDALLPGEDDWDAPEPPPAPEAGPVTAPPEALRPVIGRPEAALAIEMATSKDQIGRVLEDWLRSTFGCGLVLVVKGEMAIGWKGFFPDAEDMIEAVAVPLGKPSMMGAAYESMTTFRGAPPAEGAKLHERMWKLLRCAPPAEALVCPVVMGKRAVNLLYAHMEDGGPLPEEAVKDAEALCVDAAAGYARLIGRKKR